MDHYTVLVSLTHDGAADVAAAYVVLQEIRPLRCPRGTTALLNENWSA